MNFDVMWVIITAGEEGRDGREKEPERLAQGERRRFARFAQKRELEGARSPTYSTSAEMRQPALPNWAWCVNFRCNEDRPAIHRLKQKGRRIATLPGTQRLEVEGCSLQPCAEMGELRNQEGRPGTKKEQEVNRAPGLWGEKHKMQCT